jgi:hypothetical protein
MSLSYLLLSFAYVVIAKMSLSFLPSALSGLKNAYCFSRFLYGDQARFFDDEIHPELRHSKTGTIAMASAGENCNASQVQFLNPNLIIEK